MQQQSNGRLCVFLDTNVLAAYLRGEPPISQIFSNEVLKRVRFAINPIVLQELFFLAETHKYPEILDNLQAEVSMLPLNLERAEEYLQQANTLRNLLAHSNDILILSSAADCDYLVTYDRALRSLPTSKPQIVTPEQLLSQLGTKV
ncbi:twitching motility protein PilT [Scytonema hofmannii PCC 7110]|uniref:Twitching motility protein PilT n=1 Tax=Scytonema hofmannii PCC 7110 TaxID=128403 RepID=A0A139XEW3_9CYAN|nr:type II toxin-antitoxin system VapC family toxin [Scytonema hofmannii]KYC43227.1 twitching motility protein PilT [Scytonema hofmannii PCC 7110]